VEINVLEMIRENINIPVEGSPGYYELKMRKSCFDEGSSKLLDRKKPP
jgi:hypothetical protein